ncbi:MAG: dTMP kinase [Alphaproteobacteria bacterium]
MARGRFITFEGGEGAGKSTQVQALVARLNASGIAAVATREPGGAPGAELIRRLLVDGPATRWEPLAEVLLHFAARREHVVRTVWPALERGEWVVSDRFADSTMAYQGFGQGADRGAIGAICRATLGAFAPDLTIVLDLPVELGLARAEARENGGKSRYERMDRAMHERLRDGFLAIARGAPERCVVLDATADAGSVAAAVSAAVSERLGITLDGR